MAEQQFQKTISVPALFNNESLLEFNIEGDKRFLVLRNSYLSFYVELEEHFIPDNNFGCKVSDT